MRLDEEPRWGLYRAEVVVTGDPEQRNRVRLRIPQVLGNATSQWAEPDRPSQYTPTLHSSVWVQFAGGDVGKPVYAAIVFPP